jgi:hypothetical protein
LLSTPTRLGVSASDALGIFAKEARLPEIAPSLICRLVGRTSKPPELHDRVEGGVSLGVGVSSLSCSSTIANEAGGLPILFPYCDFMSDSICCGPRKGRWVDAFLIVEADSEFGDLVADSSSRPGVAGAAYLPSFEGGASLWPCGTEGSTSRVGAAYRPKFAGGALQSPFCIIEGLVFRPAEAGVDVGLLKFNDMFAVDGNI